eukprot:TRINITY_DN78472_c0_g1_i1.p1 TRINITY_DN78472_c0_g1~~TRINITY_DN78472_c0_g1_i1.p1  ORF type:complete len:454 (-),score=45.38 TRINITY_DN78472_c0_g1_i1:2-1363(-)
MEVLLTEGKTAFVINVITEAFVILTGFGLIRSLNAYGRWKLYNKGKANMNLHFHETTVLPALQNAFTFRRSSRAVVVLFCIQAAVSAIILTLKTVAPIGISQSNSFRVTRNRTQQGDAVCRENGPSYALGYLGEAMQKLVTHFDAGGGVLSVGRTGRNSDALVLEDKKSSLGLPYIVNEFSKPIEIMISARLNDPNVTIDAYKVMKKDSTTDSEFVYDVTYTFKTITYPEVGVQVTEGPLYAIYLFHGPRRERYTFVRCDVPTMRLRTHESRIVRGGCNIANLERDTTKTGEILSVEPVPQLLRELDNTYKELNISALGHRWIMLFDVAKALSQQPCGDSYVAYLPFSEVSNTTVVLLCVLLGIALASLLGAMISFLHTRHTFDWNGSYERVINLAAHSDSIQLESSWDIATPSDANVVVEAAKVPGGSYRVQVVPKGSASNPIPKANIKLIK